MTISTLMEVEVGKPLEVGPPEVMRFHTLLILIGQQIVNTMLWISFAPVAVEVSAFYGVSIQWVNTLSTICLFLFPVGMLWGSWMTARCGLRRAMLAASFLNLAASCCRCASYPLVFCIGGGGAYCMLLIGQMLSAFAQPIFTNTPARIANDWFPVNERDMATTVGNIGFGLGNVVGMGLPGLVVTMDASTAQVHGLGNLLLQQVVISLLAFAWCCAGFSEEPQFPPSHAAACRRQERSRSQAEEPISISSVLNVYATLLRNWPFLLLLGAFSILLGGFNAIFTDMEQLLKPASYTFADASAFGNWFVVAGFVTSGLSGVLLDRTHAYITMLRACFISTFLAAFHFMMQIKPGNYGMLMFASVLFGASSLPLLPVTLNCAVEATFPTPEEDSTGLLILGGNYAGAVFSYMLAAFIEMAPSYNGTVWTVAAKFTVSALAVALVCSLSFNTPYKRQAAEIESVDACDSK